MGGKLRVTDEVRERVAEAILNVGIAEGLGDHFDACAYALADAAIAALQPDPGKAEEEPTLEDECHLDLWQAMHNLTRPHDPSGELARKLAVLAFRRYMPTPSFGAEVRAVVEEMKGYAVELGSESFKAEQAWVKLHEWAHRLDSREQDGG